MNTKGAVGEISDELKEVLIYLDEGRTTGEYTRQLDDAVRLVKSSEERRHEYMVMMIREMEIREEGREEGRKEGNKEGKILGTMRDDGKDDQAIIARLIKKYGLTEKEAEGYVLPAAII